MRSHIYTLVCSVVLLGLCSCGDDDKNGIYPPGYNPDSDNGMCEADEITYELYDGEAWVFKLPSRETVEIPQTVQHNKKAFAVTKIMNSAGNRQVRNLSIPSSIKEIESGAFANTDIKVLYIDDLISWCNIDFRTDVYMGHNPFSYSYACPIQSDTRVFIDGEEIKDTLIIPSAISMINSNAFQNLNCKEVIIPSDVKVIGTRSFSNSSVGTLRMAGVEEIWDYAFEDCANLKEIDFGNSLNRIGQEAFINCVSLGEIYLPHTVSSIGQSAFQDSGMTSINIPSGLKEMGEAAYASSSLERIDIESLTGWMEVNYNNFYVTGPWETPVDAYINGEPFVRATPGMMPGITTVNKFNFNFFKNLESIELPEGVQRMEEYSCGGCISLKTLIIPASMEWFNCTLSSDSLQSLVMSCREVPAHDEFFRIYDNVLQNCTLYVPEESLDLYRNDPVYGQFRRIEKIDYSEAKTTEADYLQISSEIYDLNGRKVNPSDSNKGIYIIREGNSTRKVKL